MTRRCPSGSAPGGPTTGWHASGQKAPQAYMHSPWERKKDLLDFMDDGRITESSLEGRIQKALRYAKDVSDAAEDRGFDKQEIFQGHVSSDGVITVLGPTEDFYVERLLASSDTPKVSEEETARAVFQDFWKASTEVAQDGAIQESMDIESETLVDPPPFDTSHRNNQSLILGIRVDEKQILLTADAGIEALASAVK